MRAVRACSVRWVGLVAGLSLQCASAQRTPTITDRAPAALSDRDGQPCPGAITAPEVFRPIEDAAMRAEALGARGAGKLCAAQTYEVTQTVRVFRIWNSAQSFSAHGRWWTLTPPGSSREAYRAANAVCPEWSALDRIIECDLRVGTHVALGPGQSVTCEGSVSFPASATLQLYVPNDTRATPPQLFVERCTDGAPWP